MPLVRASLIYGALFYLPVFRQSIERFIQLCRRCNDAPVASLFGLGKTDSCLAKLTLT
ncbi:hypothetical protein SAMN04488490_4094 [Marinobacter sp. LV10R510-11A]|nr:hypothetical protein SAMN04488490_4094 [Marinobacter sp. LV10R510-11A]